VSAYNNKDWYSGTKFKLNDSRINYKTYKVARVCLDSSFMGITLLQNNGNGHFGKKKVLWVNRYTVSKILIFISAFNHSEKLISDW
jgi:hypothetical protein